jgi:hypothetical protein
MVFLIGCFGGYGLFIMLDDIEICCQLDGSSLLGCHAMLTGKVVPAC